MSNSVLVTGIGGVVGQGILRNIKACNYDIRLIGTNTEPISAGNHLCHRIYKVPFAYEDGYIEQIISICDKEKIDIILPSTDYEAYYLAMAKDKLPTLASSPAVTSKIFLDKYLTWQEFTKHGIPFAETVLPVDYKDQFSENVVKPREGRGSRDIHINHKMPASFSDEYIVQRLYHGIEITTAFYVIRNNKLLGHITMERTLIAGATHSCSVTFDYNDAVEQLIREIISKFEIRGSCNIQSIVTEDKVIVPFEINCRISGTNSIRAQFGFKDVKYTIDEYLYNKTLEKPKVSKGAAVRILMDLIYPGISLDQIKDKQTEYYLF